MSERDERRPGRGVAGDPLLQGGRPSTRSSATPSVASRRHRPEPTDRRLGLILFTVACILITVGAVGYVVSNSDEPRTEAALSDAALASIPSVPPSSLATDTSSVLAPAASTLPATTLPTTGIATTTTSTTTTSTTTTTTTTTLPPGPEERVIGTSVLGTPIVARRSGTPGGLPVLAVGVIHGDEPGGLQITAAMRQLEVPTGVELWIIDTVNPDGLAANTRGNANGVDLNRNADGGSWAALGEGTDRYSGPSAASEPETKAVQAFLDEVRPVFAVWWHQVGNHVDDNDSVARYDVLLRFAELVGLPVEGTSCVTACVGTISGYLNDKLGSTAFVVELPASYGGDVAATHAGAFLQIAGELAADLSAEPGD